MEKNKNNILTDVFLTGQVFYDSTDGTFIKYDSMSEDQITYKLYTGGYQIIWNKEISERNITIQTFMQEYITTHGTYHTTNKKNIPNLLQDYYNDKILGMLMDSYKSSVTRILDGI